MDVTVMIIDTDASYQILGRKFTSLPIALNGIRSDLEYLDIYSADLPEILGPTPLGVSRPLKLDKALKIAKIAENYHKNNEKDIETVYDMKNIFKGDIKGVTVEMLDSVEHTPAVIVRTHLITLIMSFFMGKISHQQIINTIWMHIEYYQSYITKLYMKAINF